MQYFIKLIGLIMDSISFEKAYFIKLGQEGKWEEDSIKNSYIRIGWSIVDINDINTENWGKVRKVIETHFLKNGKKRGISQDFNSLKNIYESNSKTIFITFIGLNMYWCQSSDLNKPKVYEDEVSKFIKLDKKWQSCDINGNELKINNISTKLTQVRRFPGACCEIHEISYLNRLLNGLTSNEYQAIQSSREKLINEVENGIKLLHEKDFELLIDLIFRQSGWHRISVLGKTEKDIDIELQDPVSGLLFVVQVKSKADVKQFEIFANKFTQTEYTKAYFVVHSPNENLINYKNDDENIELVLSKQIAEYVVGLGLTGWLIERIK